MSRMRGSISPLPQYAFMVCGALLNTGTILLFTLLINQLLGKLIVTHLVNKFPEFYGKRRFITVFIRIRHHSISWARWIQFIPTQPIFLTYILISSSHQDLGLWSGLFASGLPTKISVCFLTSSIRATCPIKVTTFLYIFLRIYINAFTSRSYYYISKEVRFRRSPATTPYVYLAYCTPTFKSNSFTCVALVAAFVVATKVQDRV